MTEHNLFCYAKDYNDEDSFQQKRWRAFNKVVGERRYFEIKEEVEKIFDDLELKLDKNAWSYEWKKVSKEQWKELSEIKEFDKKVVEEIIGFELDLDDDLVGEEVEVKVKGKTYKAIINQLK